LAAAFCVWLAAPQFWGYLIGLVLWGFKSAFTSGTFEALLYDELQSEERGEDYTEIYGRMRAVQAGGVLLAAIGASFASGRGYGLSLAASLAATLCAGAAALSLPPARRATSMREQGYLSHLRSGLRTAFQHPEILTILVFSSFVLALGAALEEFWPIFGAKVGLTRPVISLFVGAQNAIEVLVSLVAFRFASLDRRAFYALFVVAAVMLIAAAGLFSPGSMLLLALYSGVMKVIGVVFEGRLQGSIRSDHRATVGSVKGLLSEIVLAVLYMSFGPLAALGGYQIAFLACGVAGMAVGLCYLLARPRFPTRSEASQGPAAS
jgi:hypothetical protein